MGNVRDQFATSFLESRSYIVLHGALEQSELHKQLSSFDVGLALENKREDINRDICLTNKIWAYLQAGLYILATDTMAQKQFMEERPWAGEVISFDSDLLQRKLDWLMSNLENIRNQSADRYRMAQEYSWEKEGEKLINNIQEILAE
jgi:glycosyltransferase involved in cell wall biosynthesis